MNILLVNGCHGSGVGNLDVFFHTYYKAARK